MIVHTNILMKFETLEHLADNKTDERCALPYNSDFQHRTDDIELTLRPTRRGAQSYLYLPKNHIKGRRTGETALRFSSSYKAHLPPSSYSLDSHFLSKSTVMKFTTIAIALPVLVASQVAAICPGFNFGIGNEQDLGNGVHRCMILF